MTYFEVLDSGLGWENTCAPPKSLPVPWMRSASARPYVSGVRLPREEMRTIVWQNLSGWVYALTEE